MTLFAAPYHNGNKKVLLPRRAPVGVWPSCLFTEQSKSANRSFYFEKPLKFLEKLW